MVNRKTKNRKEIVMYSYLPEGVLISTQKNKDYTSTLAGLERARDMGLILEAHALLCDHELNLHVDLPCGIKGIIPKDEAIYSPGAEITKDIAILTRVGKTVCFKVIDIKTSGEITTAILSRRAAQEECHINYIRNLIPGDIIKAKTTHIESFGAFADIGCGIISLLSIDSISVSRISHPSERLSVNDVFYAVIKGRDELGRINLSTRELLGTWDENARLFSEGQTVRGTVRGVESYGIFVELTPNLAGLAEYKDNIKSGQSAAVYIKSIIPEKMKVKLIIIDTQDDNIAKDSFDYFINVPETKHINHWRYSPEKAGRVIESVFT